VGRDRIVRYLAAGRSRWGLLEHDLVRECLVEPFERLELGADAGRLEDLELLPPVRPTKIICVGRNYPAHAAEHQSEVPSEPLLFFKPPSSIIGPGASIALTPLSQLVEHEAEMALVIGRRCRNVRPDEAWDCVLGITCANDVTARDIQRSDRLWTRAKGFDTFCPVGPWVVTGMTLGDVSDLAVTARVNGEVRQSGRTSEMVFGPVDLIVYLSTVMTLEPGDLLLTGTPAGVGPLEPGDLVEVEVDILSGESL